MHALPPLLAAALAAATVTIPSAAPAHGPLGHLTDTITPAVQDAVSDAAGGATGHGAVPPPGAAPITVEGPFARATAGPARNGAVYLVVRNAGDRADRLIGARADVSARAELHTHQHEGGVMRMRPVDAIAVPAGGTATLAPGGGHVMLVGLTAPLVKGETFALTLVFEAAGEIPVTVTVGSVGAMAPGHGHGGGHGGGHEPKSGG